MSYLHALVEEIKKDRRLKYDEGNGKAVHA